MICNGCLREIDPAFDSVSRDARDRSWHTTCWVKARGAQDIGPNPNDAGAMLFATSPVLYAGAKLIDRFQRRKWRD